MRVTIAGLALDLDVDQVADLREQLSVPVPENLRNGILVDTAEAATIVGMSPEWVREHGAELGGVKMGDGPKARWRFDAAGLASSGSRPELVDPPVADRRVPRRAPRRARTGQLLKSRG